MYRKTYEVIIYDDHSAKGIKADLACVPDAAKLLEARDYDPENPHVRGIAAVLVFREEA